MRPALVATLQPAPVSSCFVFDLLAEGFVQPVEERSDNFL
jgi:hypothetical protein